MTFEQLEYFVAAVEADTFFDAAERCSITQSALSKQMMKLERELELSLWDRSRRTAVLTEAGRCFYDEAQALLEQYSRMRETMARFRRSIPLRVGTLPIVSQYGLMPRIRQFTSLHSDIPFSLVELEEQAMLDSFRRGRLDLILTRSDLVDLALHSFAPLAEDRLVVLFPAGHPLAESPSVSVEQVAGEPFLLMPPHTCLYHFCLDVFRHAGITPRIVRTARMETLLGAVAVSEGLSLLAEDNFRLFRSDSVRAVPLVPSPPLHVGVAWKKRVPLSPSARLFLSCLQADPTGAASESVCDQSSSEKLCPAPPTNPRPAGT